MSIKINGLKYLDANNYKKMMIREESGEYKIGVTPFDDNFNTIPNNYKLSDDFRDLNDEEKIMIIIDSFLRYTRINELKTRVMLERYAGKFEVVKGTRELDLRIYNSKLGILNKKIIDKYRQDRFDFHYSNQEVNNYEITTSENTSSYEKIEGNQGTKIKFTLVCKDDKLKNFEEEFLREILVDKLYNSDEEARIVCHNMYNPYHESYIYLGKYLECGNFRIRINCNRTTEHVINNIVDQYNEERNIAKKMQLKLEGF